MKEIIYKPIGIIHSPFKETKGTPIQPVAAGDTEGVIELFSEYTEGLLDLDGFSHIILLFHCHLSNKLFLKVKPYMDDTEHGVFSTRAPSRPNAIGLSIVRLIRLEKNLLYIKDVDIVDGTPLLDIKPYVEKFDYRADSKKGWLEKKIKKLPKTKDDGRFVNQENE
ncbi:MAG: tRNA (N6-threonylcarbamoyladenosine(37)-N6)-methyltransferase TrmO [Spirochaetales bacterium]|nr:tRNA (N6-threonylcarbamoyladenosine(37)-N6)-methyltransferase TrmO [Spirochaetales bacterium]